MTDEELRMEAYYYSFDKTGQVEIDRILSAVACAGKAFHHTNDWNDEATPRTFHEGATPIDWIQNRAKEAADTIEALRAENARLQKENWEYVARGYALINMLPDETMAGEIQDARHIFGGVVDALRAENAQLKDALLAEIKANVEFTRKQADEIVRLRKALNPFAVVAEMTIGESEDDRDLFRPARNGPRLIVADFRKARAARGETE